MGDEMEGVLKNSMSAYNRRIADLKVVGEISTHEGKQPISQSGYRYLAEATIQQSDDFNLYITYHCFLLLCWNLIVRAVSVGNILFDSISWEEDAMTIHIGKMNNDRKAQTFLRGMFMLISKILLFVQCWQCQS